MTDVTLDQVCLIAIGGNLASRAGDPAATLRAALRDLDAQGLRVVTQSRLFITPAFPAGAGPDYINAAATLRCNLPAGDVLDRLHAIEATYGRRRDARWAPRSLDLDLLAIGDLVLPDRVTWRQWHDLPAEKQAETVPDQLILPHPRLHERAFVLVPLAEVAPDWRHPVLGLSVREMLARLPENDRSAAKPL